MNTLSNPRITEKASVQQAAGVYVFDVAVDATKRDVISAVKKTYGVTPRMVRTVTIRPTTVRHARTGKYGTTAGGKKAYVYLKKGETINL